MARSLLFPGVIAVGVVSAAAAAMGIKRFQARTHAMRDAVAPPVTSTSPNTQMPSPPTFDLTEMVGTVPPIVLKYLETTLQRQSGTRIRQASFRQQGMFLMKPDSPDALKPESTAWSPFAAVQRFSVPPARPVGMLWEARMLMGRKWPLSSVGVHVADAYVAGEGSMRARFGPFAFMNIVGNKEINEGALLRYLSEAAWFPYALVPEAGNDRLVWSELPPEDGLKRARAVLKDGAATVAMDFSFRDNGEVVVGKAQRWKAKPDGSFVLAPWVVHFDTWTTLEKEGVRIPTSGFASWLLDSGVEQPYCILTLADVTYSDSPAEVVFTLSH